MLRSWSSVEARAETGQAGAKAEAERKLMIGRQGLNSLVLYRLIAFSVLVFKCLCSVQVLLCPDGDYNTVVEVLAVFDGLLLKFRLELKNPSYH